MKDGSPRRAHFERAARQGRRIKALHDAPQLPPGTETIWNAFLSIAPTQPREGMAGFLQPLQPTQIEAWMRCMRTPLHPKEIEAVMALDGAYRVWEAEQRTRKPADEDD